MYMLNMVIILIIMYCNVVTAIDKIPTYLLRFNTFAQRVSGVGSFFHRKHFAIFGISYVGGWLLLPSR